MIDTFWSGDNSRRIIERVVIEATLELDTPALFGGGDSDELTDMTLLVDEVENRPLLTGASLAGALRAYLWSREKGYRVDDPDKPQKEPSDHEKLLTEILFGGFKGHDNGKQSPLIVDDALGENFGVELRDGVRLDPQTRTADEKKLFNMQVWRRGTAFPIRLELLVGKPRKLTADQIVTYQTKLKRALLMALEGLTDDGITLGGRKNRGYGRFTVNNWRIKSYQVTTGQGLSDWVMLGNVSLPNEAQKDSLAEVGKILGVAVNDLPDERCYFQLRATFKLDGSLLIRANGQPNSNSPDMVHLSNHEGKPVLPGTSVAGALRQRARRILNLVNPTQAEDWLNSLFGDEDINKRESKASRLIVEETIIDEPQFDLVQNRVAIDRFTGGALDSALFNEQPVFGKPKTRLKINLRLVKPVTPYYPDPKKSDTENEADFEKQQEQDEKTFQSQIGLLLLLLKDLWTGDLPLGGENSVGRGRLAGLCATLVYKSANNNDPILWGLTQESENAPIKFENVTATQLQNFVDALHGKEVENGTHD